MLDLPTQNMDDVISRIQKIYNTCNAQEQECLKKILTELSIQGYSDTYNDIWMADYKEIPVDIDTFVTHEYYLGSTNRKGEAVFPFWRGVFRDIFYTGNTYDEIVFTGATRIGKTSSVITCVCYMLYRLMCLRDPQAFFNKKEVSIFSILFFNVTKELAKGVAFREFNDTLKLSPWFCEHGTFTSSELNYVFIPEGGKITIDYGSDASHGLGKQVFCLVGDTDILTESGYVKLEDVADTYINVGQYDGSDIVYTPAQVCKTKMVTDTIRLTLEDGSVIEGTPDHRILLSDGTYKQLKDIDESDDLLTL